MSASAFRSQVAVFVDRGLSPQAQSARLAAYAKSYVAEAIRANRAPPSYRRFVDGREGVPDEAVKPDGVIVYQFNMLPEAVAFALAYLVQRSPVLKGRYAKGWFVAVDGLPWTGQVEDIPVAARVTVTNREPYHRKIDVGGQKVRVPPGLVEDARQAMRTRFPLVECHREFVRIPNPYVLKGRRGRARAGEEMTYPALVFTLRR